MTGSTTSSLAVAFDVFGFVPQRVRARTHTRTRTHVALQIVTGKGQPDVASRLFLKLLKTSLNLPILALMDSDPHGVRIMSVAAVTAACWLWVGGMSWAGGGVGGVESVWRWEVWNWWLGWWVRA
jgi:hypothetical protein